jgi:hypothetical protein
MVCKIIYLQIIYIRYRLFGPRSGPDGMTCIVREVMHIDVLPSMGASLLPSPGGKHLWQ